MACGHYFEVVALLVRAGPKLDSAWFEDDEERNRAVQKLRFRVYFPCCAAVPVLALANSSACFWRSFSADRFLAAKSSRLELFQHTPHSCAGQLRPA